MRHARENAELRAEAELRAGAARLPGRRADSALVLLRDVAERRAGSDVAARAQFLVGEGLIDRGQHAEAIVEFNRVLKDYFQHSVAASAQYRVARCLDAWTAAPTRPAATRRWCRAIPRARSAGRRVPGRRRASSRRTSRWRRRPTSSSCSIATRKSDDGGVARVRPRPSTRSWSRPRSACSSYCVPPRGQPGPARRARRTCCSRKMPPSRSPWRAWALLIDADASAAQARYPEAQATLERLGARVPRPCRRTPRRPSSWPGPTRGRASDSLAIATEERLLRAAARASRTARSSAPPCSTSRTCASTRSATARRRRVYEDFLRRFPAHPQRLARPLPGRPVLPAPRPGRRRRGPLGGDRARQRRRAHRRARLGPRGRRLLPGRALRGRAPLLRGPARALRGQPGRGARPSLRLAQCAYNAGEDAEALEAFAATQERFPDSPVAREARRGTELALYRLSQRPDGARVLGELVERFPSSAFAADAQLQIARRAYEEKRFVEAAEGFRRVVSGFPGYSAADQAQFLLADSLGPGGTAGRGAPGGRAVPGLLPRQRAGHDRALPARASRDFEAHEYLRAALAFTQVLSDSASSEMRGGRALQPGAVPAAARARRRGARRAGALPRRARRGRAGGRRGLPARRPRRGRGPPRRGAAGVRAGAGLEARAGSWRSSCGYRLGLAREQLGETDAALRAYQQARGRGASAATPSGSPPWRAAPRSTRSAGRRRRPSPPTATSSPTRRTRSWWRRRPSSVSQLEAGARRR